MSQHQSSVLCQPSPALDDVEIAYEVCSFSTHISAYIPRKISETYFTSSDHSRQMREMRRKIRKPT